MTLLSQNSNEHKDKFVNEIQELEYKAYLKQKLEKEIEENLHKKFSKNFRISISADADILTDSELDNDEKIEVLKLISTYLLDFDIKSLNYESRN
jgi:Zn-finger domain-containing protein